MLRACLNPFLFLLIVLCANAATNITVDDTFGDPVAGAKLVYSPESIWAGPECTGCSIQPNKKLASNGTWKAATYKPEYGSMSIQLSFKGTAVYVYFIIPNNVVPDYITTEAACEFKLDGMPAGTYNHTRTSSPTYDYNALVYSNHILQNDNHNLVISTSGLDRHIFLAFDYAIYTTDDISTSQSKASVTPTSSNPLSTESSSATSPPARAEDTVPVAAIAGGAGGLVVILALLLIYFFCRRKLKRRLRTRRVSPSGPPTSSSSDNLYHDFNNLAFVAPRTVLSDQQGILDGRGFIGSNMHADARNHVLETPQMAGQAELGEVRHGALKQETRNRVNEMEMIRIRGPAGGSERIHDGGMAALLQSQTVVMREQIELLRAQQLMDGMTDAPPPYSTN